MGILILLIVIGTSIWVLFDAKAIGVKRGQIKGMANMEPVGWFLTCLGIWIIAFPFYLVKRSEFRRINQGLKIEDSKEFANKNKATFSIAGIVAGVLILLFLLGFHIVIYSGGVTLIPKEHLSFSETIVHVEDIIRQYNNRDFGQVLRGERVNLYLVRKLEDKGIITSTARPIDSSHSSSFDPSGGSIDEVKQKEAKMILKQIYTMQHAYRQEYGSYCCNGASASGGGLIPDLGIDIMADARYTYYISAGKNSFIARAMANLDYDATNDIWEINERGELKCVSNDASN